MINTLTEWKAQFQVGKQFRQVWNRREINVDNLYTVSKVQTNGIFATCPRWEHRSWMDFPKRKDITFTENGWISKDGEYELAAYEWVSSEK